MGIRKAGLNSQYKIEGILPEERGTFILSTFYGTVKIKGIK